MRLSCSQSYLPAPNRVGWGGRVGWWTNRGRLVAEEVDGLESVLDEVRQTEALVPTLREDVHADLSTCNNSRIVFLCPHNLHTIILFQCRPLTIAADFRTLLRKFLMSHLLSIWPNNACFTQTGICPTASNTNRTFDVSMAREYPY